MKTATVRELRNNFAQVSRWLEAGEQVEITKRGIPYAKVELTAAPQKAPKKVSQMMLKERRTFFRKRFGAEHTKWMKQVYGDKVFKDNMIITMREEKDW
jgi:antitoxin (DNA-binding transcriptional repressor) of toxin-antitoxin stability system